MLYIALYHKTIDKLGINRIKNYDISILSKTYRIIVGYFFSWLLFLKILIMPILHPIIFFKRDKEIIC